MRTVVTWLTEKLPSGWAWAGVGAARTAAMRVSPMASARTGRAGRLSATRVTLPAICAVDVTQVVRWLIAAPPGAGRALSGTGQPGRRPRPRGGVRPARQAPPPRPLPRRGAGTADRASPAGGRAGQGGNPQRAAR